MEKIFIVVADGQVQKILSKDDLEIEILDFDSCFSEDEEESLADYLEDLEDNKSLKIIGV